MADINYFALVEVYFANIENLLKNKDILLDSSSDYSYHTCPFWEYMSQELPFKAQDMATVVMDANEIDLTPILMPEEIYILTVTFFGERKVKIGEKTIEYEQKLLYTKGPSIKSIIQGLEL
ncbi:MAG: hypothetical protein ATN35_03195 [Epulopiscium sp. Nele67-Bin004]|nr:MAG: hypothetical protein ATN35_03195 [Epulopiscium sp. Nele67-Bin004]